MIDRQPLHKAQISILEALRHNKALRFSELMQPTGLTSDAFKFHVRKLVHAGVVEKSEAGEYHLTVRGKEIANTINRNTRVSHKQPKLSVLLVITRKGEHDTEYLVQKRLRHPFYGYWSFISGPVQWGEEPEISAQRELDKQTGLQAKLTVSGFYRQRDYSTDEQELLEDKLLTIVTGQVGDAAVAKDWTGGHNAWMTLGELAAQDKHFSSCAKIVAMLKAGKQYDSNIEHNVPEIY
jgi:predicted transcriptional regulator